VIRRVDLNIFTSQLRTPRRHEELLRFTLFASAGNFNLHRIDSESVLFSLSCHCALYIGCAEFDRLFARLADHESRRVVMGIMVTKDKSVQAFNPVNQTMGYQPLHRPVNRQRRLDASAANLVIIENLIGAHWLPGPAEGV